MTALVGVQYLNRDARDVAEKGPSEETILLDDNRYLADVLYDFKNAKQKDVTSKLLFKKRMFRETDEAITEPQFINLSFVQVWTDLHNLPLIVVGHIVQASAAVHLTTWFEIQEITTNIVGNPMI